MPSLKRRPVRAEKTRAHRRVRLCVRPIRGFSAAGEACAVAGDRPAPGVCPGGHAASHRRAWGPSLVDGSERGVWLRLLGTRPGAGHPAAGPLREPALQIQFPSGVY